jgi:hypothetical protein
MTLNSPHSAPDASPHDATMPADAARAPGVTLSLHKQYAQYSFWLETTGEALSPRPPLDGSVTVDVAILGAEQERKALRGHHRRDRFHGLTREEMLPRAFGFLQELRKLYPPDFFEEVHPRLRVFHLPSPPRRLSVGAFVGPFDEQVHLVPGRVGLKIVRLKKRWPRTVRGRL